MKILTTDSDPLVVDPEPSSPLVYLDHSVISDHAGESVGDRLRDAILRVGGTLCWSWALMVELLSVFPGPTFDLIKAYLVSFGTNWMPLDPNSSAVMKREKEQGDPYPEIDTDLLKAMVVNWDGLTLLSIGTLLDGLEGNTQLTKKYKNLHSLNKKEVRQVFEKARADYRSDKTVKKNLDNMKYVHTPGTPRTEFIHKELLRQCIVTNETFNPSDVFDFWHSVVSSSYCDIVVLDKKWARRMREEITLPPGVAEVYDGTEISAVIDMIERL